MSNDLGKLVLRLAFGGMLLPHGIQKIQVFAQDPAHVHFIDWLGIGATASILLSIFAEAICTIMVIIGFKTRWFAIPVLINMAVAVLVAHHGAPWMEKELPMAYLSAFAAIALLGGGKFSLDRK